MESAEKKKKDLCDKETKKEQAIAEIRKKEAKYLQDQIMNRRELETERRNDRARKARETATRILKDAKLEEEKRVELANKKQADYNARLEEQFERDKRYREVVAQKGDEAAQRERENEKRIVANLLETENTFSEKIYKKKE